MYAIMHRTHGNEYSIDPGSRREKSRKQAYCAACGMRLLMHTNLLAISTESRYTGPDMKRIQANICILVCLLLVLCACSESVVPATAAPVSPSPTPTPLVLEADELSVLPTADAPTPIPTPEPTEAPTDTPVPAPTPDPRFTMVWTSDTQTMIARASMRAGYETICSWVSTEAQAGNVAVFLHTGDMVDNGDVPGQWSLFNSGVAAIGETIPFFWSAGNHDEGYSGKSPWKKQPFVGTLPDGQKFNGGDASYMIFTVGETKLLLLSICWRKIGDSKTIAWLKAVCDAHSDLSAILLSHGYLSAKKELMNVAKTLEKDLVAVCPNIRLILSGHARGIARETFSYDDDGDGIAERTVNALMYDIQEDTAHYGYVCLLTYDPLNNTLSVDSYSPVRDDYVYDDDRAELERFTICDVF